MYSIRCKTAYAHASNDGKTLINLVMKKIFSLLTFVLVAFVASTFVSCISDPLKIIEVIEINGAKDHDVIYCFSDDVMELYDVNLNVPDSLVYKGEVHVESDNYSGKCSQFVIKTKAGAKNDIVPTIRLKSKWKDVGWKEVVDYKEQVRLYYSVGVDNDTDARKYSVSCSPGVFGLFGKEDIFVSTGKKMQEALTIKIK